MFEFRDKSVIAEAHYTPVKMDENHSLEPTVNTHPAADVEAVEINTPSDRNPPPGFAATGKFTRAPKKLFELSGKDLEETLTQLADDKLDLFARSYSSSDQQQTGFLARWRCVCGAICSVKRARIHACYAQDLPTIGWQDWCTFVGLNRKSAERYEQNWRTVIDAPRMLVEAANREGLDLLQPRIADNLKVILVELAGRQPSAEELPKLLTRLKQSAPPKPPSNKPKSLDDARQSFSKVFERIPEQEILEADPLFLTFATSAPTAQMSVVVRNLFWNFVNSSTPEQQLETAELFLETVQAEVDDIRKKLNPPTASDESTAERPGESLNQQEPSPELNAESVPPASEPESEPSTEQRTLFGGPSPWERVEITAKPDLYALTGSRRRNVGDDNNLTFVSTKRKLPIRETFAEEFVDSLAGGL